MDATPPGASIHIDGQVLQEDEEDEMQVEEQTKQNELRELLTNAFDDLIDEETSSVSSNDSRDSGTHSGDKPINPITWPGWNSAGMAAGYASTPIGHRLPPPPGGIHFPAFGQTYPVHPGYFPPVPFNYPGYLASVSPSSGVVQQYQPVAIPLHEREETEGGNETPTELSAVDGDGATTANQHMAIRPEYEEPSQYPFSDGGKDSHNVVNNAYDNYDKFNEIGHVAAVEYDSSSANYRVPSEKTYEISQYPLSDNSDGGHRTRIQLASHRDFHKTDVQPAYEKTEDVSHSGEHRNYTVEYVAKSAEHCSEHTSDVNVKNSESPFIDQGGSTSDRERAQLLILYEARGRQLEELQQKFDDTTETTSREIRVLKHQLAMCEGEKLGALGSLDESSKLVRSLQQETDTLQCKVTSLESQLDDLTSVKDEVVRKLQAAESTIESLNQQLFEVRSSESLTRARELHESMLSNMRLKHEQEVLSMREKIDQVQRALDDKIDEVSQLRLQLSESVKASDKAQIDRADTVNRLTRSLEESQRQCRELLESGASSELGNLKVQLNQAIASKCISEDLCGTLQVELSELKEQLSYFEAASQLGVLSSGSPGTDRSDVSPSESFAQLNINKSSSIPLSWKTPKTHKTEIEGSMLAGEIVPKLKSEMQRILLNNKAKREQVTRLQGELKAARDEVAVYRQQKEEIEKRCSGLEETIQRLEADLDAITPDSMGVNGREKALKRQLEVLRSERESLCLELEELKNTLAEVGSSEERVTEINAELRQQMAQMVSDCDEDKRVALEKCQEACLQHHENTKEHLRQDLEEQHAKICAELTHDFEMRLKKLREECDETLRELDGVKEMYVVTCREKDELEDVCKRKFEKELENKLTEMKAQLEKEKEEDLTHLREMETHNLTEIKENWSKTQESQLQRLVETKVTAAKTQWFQEQKMAREKAIRNAVDLAEQKLKLDYESRRDGEIQQQIAEAKPKWEAEKRLSFENELRERITCEKEKWQGLADQLMETSIKEAVSKARTEWMGNVEKGQQRASLEAVAELEKKHKAELENKVRQAVDEAKEAWNHEKEKLIKEAIESTSLNLQKSIAKLTEDLDFMGKSKELISQELETERRTWQSERGVISRELEDVQEKLSETVRSMERVRERGQEAQQEVESLKAKLWKSQQALSEKEIEWRNKMDSQQESHEQEYKQFLTEQRNDLNLALKRSRDEFENEKVQIVTLHTEALKSLTTKHEQKLSQEIERVTREWAVKTERLQTLLDQQSVDGSEHEKWQAERGQLLGELEQKEALLSTADRHLEQEVNRLRQEMESAHQRHLQEEMSKLRRESLSPEEKQKYLDELSNAQKQLKQLENTYEHQIEALQEKLRQKDVMISEQQARFEERLRGANKDSAVKSRDFEQEIEQLTLQLEKSESRRSELKDLLARTERDQEEVVGRYRQRNEELSARINQLEVEDDRLQAEHVVAMETMKEKMMRLRTEHDTLLEGLKREHAKEKLTLEKIAMSSDDKDVREKEAQTDRSEVQMSVTEKVKGQYMQTIKKIKSEVMKHVNETNTRAAQTVKSQVAKAQHETGKQLRKYYLQCLNEILSDPNCQNKAAQMSRMEQALHLTDNSRRGSNSSDVNSLLHTMVDKPLDDFIAQFTSGVNENERPVTAMSSEGAAVSSVSWRWNDRLAKRTGDVPTYKYVSLKESAANRGTSLSNIHIDPSDVGLSRLPQQPRQFNPPPEKLSSVESSRSSSPVERCNNLSSLKTKVRSEESRLKSFPVKSVAAASNSSDNSSKTNSLSRRQPMKALPTEDVQRMLAKVPQDAKKPVSVATQQTQMPSPMISKH